MTDTVTSIVLAVLTLLTLAAWGLSLRRLWGADEPGRHVVAGRAQQVIVAGVGGVTAGLFAYRWLVVHGAWQPLTAHVDGLMLIAALFAGVIAFLQTRPRLFGLSAFGLPVLAVILAWAVCAATWTYRPFNIDTLHPVWRAVHLTGVYLGTLGSAIAAIAGAMYLYVQSRLKRKQTPAQFGRLASLEALESLIIRTATLGFALLTLGLVAGVVILVDEPEALGSITRYLPKLVLATLAWLSYAVVMNVRFAASFRGRRAAWLAIGGLVLLLAVYGVVNALPRGEGESARVSSFEFRVPSCEPSACQASNGMIGRAGPSAPLRDVGGPGINSKLETRNSKPLKPEVSTCVS
ncbi:cytochrome c biogenesis protein CcsA [Phycisphaerales bacterium AB-hyl4]|uniref:Cytochrome c biogenesis protein CcsA n=1 Tax=Natronomicrosphaera hydrolytica TaxID=3242702 RepID=A0ABV4U8B4_9BACT